MTLLFIAVDPILANIPVTLFPDIIIVPLFIIVPFLFATIPIESSPVIVIVTPVPFSTIPLSTNIPVAPFPVPVIFPRFVIGAALFLVYSPIPFSPMLICPGWVTLNWTEKIS